MICVVIAPYTSIRQIATEGISDADKFRKVWSDILQRIKMICVDFAPLHKYRNNCTFRNIRDALIYFQHVHSTVIKKYYVH